MSSIPKRKGRLSTHVTDTTTGCPAAGMDLGLYEWKRGRWHLIKTDITNPEGHVTLPLLAGDEMRTGRFEIRFHAGEYYRRRFVPLPDPPFLDLVPVSFGIADPAAHYHIQLQVSPWAYSTFRGT